MTCRFMLLVAGLALMSATAAGEISSETVTRYNTAAGSSDVMEQISAADTLASEAMASAEDSRAALLAYEAAWMMCQNGACKRAIKPARFAAGLPSSDAHPVREDRDLLLSYALWKSQPNRKNRSALDAALTNMVGKDVSLLSVTAFQDRYVTDLDDGRFERAEKTAGEAARHFYPVREKIGAIWADAELATHVGAFNGRSDPEAMIGVAFLSVYLNRESYVLGGAPDWMMDRYYQAEAWRLAMEAYFLSVDEAEAERAYAERISTDSEVYFFDISRTGSAVRFADGLAICGGQLSRMPAPRYPRAAAVRGQFGSVIISLAIKENGELTPRVGASVPNDRFEDAVLESFKNVKWEWKDPAPGDPPCTRVSQRAFFPFVFILG